jgi:multiple sugar transport system substrate-binding protein
MTRSSRSPTARPAATGTPVVNRRDLLKLLGVTAGAVTLPELLAACGSGKSGGGSGTSSKLVSVGSNASDAVPKQAYVDVFAKAKAATGLDIRVNTVDHNTFQQQINSYLQGTPQDVFFWFAGNRMQFFAQKGLATPISDVWEKIGPNFTEPLKAASTGTDGQQYFVPFYYYPWAVFYRKSVFEQHGYQPAKTWDEYVALLKQQQKDGLTPLAMADDGGWPVMGTFDYINMRTNGYQFHIDLMNGKESWTDARVKTTFDHWAEILPYHDLQGGLARKWEEAAATLVRKKSAMFLLGMFVGQQFKGADKDDLDFFAFPEINPQFGQDSVEAPIDGFMLSRKLKNEDGSKKLLEYLAGTEAVQTYLKSDPNNIAANTKADTSGYDTLQKKAVELIGSAQHISQFLDRDSRPDFVSTVMIPSLQEFIKNPKDTGGLLSSIEKQKQSIFVG